LAQVRKLRHAEVEFGEEAASRPLLIRRISIQPRFAGQVRKKRPGVGTVVEGLLQGGSDGPAEFGDFHQQPKFVTDVIRRGAPAA
jgi:hypothetical protein